MDFVSGVKRFLVEKFWTPVTNESVFYNPFNTTVYAVLFAAAAVYIGLPLLKRLNIKLDREFFIGITPYVFLGGALRALKDINAVNTILLETPFIYIVMFGFVAATLYISRKAARIWEIEYFKPFAFIGLIALGSTLTFYTVNNWFLFSAFTATVVTWSVLGYALLRVFPDFLKPSFYLPIAAHMLDASTSFVGLSFAGSQEKHVLGRLFIDLMGPVGMFAMKLLIIVPVVYYINENMEGEKKRYYLFIIALLGVAIATRNLLQILALG